MISSFHVIIKIFDFLNVIVDEQLAGITEVDIGIYKLVKAKKRRKKDLGNIRYIKDDNDQIPVNDEDINMTWGT